MFYIYLWVYTFFIVIVWGFLSVIVVHSYKFKNFNSRISFFIKLLFGFFWVLTIIWYTIIFYNMNNLGKSIEINLNSNHITTEKSY